MYISVLSRYLIKTYLVKFLLVLLIVIAALMLSNIFDLLQRVKSINFQWYVFFQLAFLKIPYLALELLPIISMLTAFALYFTLAKSNELFIIWGAGVSVYGLLLPLILLNFAIGIVSITIFNPLSTYMLIKYEMLEGKMTERKIPYLTLSNLGVMVAEQYDTEKRIYVARSVMVPERDMLNVSIFFTDSDNNLQSRLEANRAHFEEHTIVLYNVSIFSPENIKTNYSEYRIPSNLKITNLVEGVKAPDHVNLWQLPSTIYTLSQAGFPTFKHQIYYYKLLFKPLAMVTYLFLATCFITYYCRTKNNMQQLALGILTGIVASLISQITSNILAYNGVEIIFAILLPLVVISLTSNFVMLHWRRD